jgi:hypothetical protein
VSIAFYCRDLHLLDKESLSAYDGFGGLVQTSHGEYRFLMVRVGGVWVECLERLAVSYD